MRTTRNSIDLEKIRLILIPSSLTPFVSVMTWPRPPLIRVRPPDDAAHDSGSIAERLRLILRPTATKRRAT